MRRLATDIRSGNLEGLSWWCQIHDQSGAPVSVGLILTRNESNAWAVVSGISPVRLVGLRSALDLFLRFVPRPIRGDNGLSAELLLPVDEPSSPWRVLRASSISSASMSMLMNIRASCWSARKALAATPAFSVVCRAASVAAMAPTRAAATAIPPAHATERSFARPPMPDTAARPAARLPIQRSMLRHVLAYSNCVSDYRVAASRTRSAPARISLRRSSSVMNWSRSWGGAYSDSPSCL